MTAETLSSQNFRIRLQGELLSRLKRNPRYSLRAFARSVGCDFSTLAKILKGQRSVGPGRISRFGRRLGLSPEVIAQYQRTAPVPGRPAAGAAQKKDFVQLAEDSFAVISDWYHYAILELMCVRGFKRDPVWIGNALGIAPEEAEAAVGRLVRVGLLEITSRGQWLDRSGGYVTTVGAAPTAEAFRRLQRQVLGQAAEALDNVPVERRDQSSVTMAVDVGKLPEARKRIQKFRRELGAFLAKGPNQDVYTLSISLFPVTSLRRELP
jgi:plasmid maintenance system antidote protein VapI